MNSRSQRFLAALLDAPSPSGYEGPARRVWCEAVREVADQVEVDVHGNAIATLNPDGAPHVMLAGHIDEIGFQVCHVDEQGTLRFRPIGGHDLRAVAGRRVEIHAEQGPVPGVIGQRPVHLLRDRARQNQNPPKASELWIDCGFCGRKEAAKVVQIGDPVTYAERFALLRNEIAVARGFDDRVGAFVVAEVLRALARSRSLEARVSAVATVQEEVGLRGARTSAYGLDPDAGIAVDVTWATDNPGGEAKELGEVKLGGGPVLGRGPAVNPPLHALLKDTARRQRVTVQQRSIPGGSGTDANAIQLTRAGVATALVSIPNRYMHSPVELCHLGDVEATIKLVAAVVRRLGPATSFIPD